MKSGAAGIKRHLPKRASSGLVTSHMSLTKMSTSFGNLEMFLMYLTNLSTSLENLATYFTNCVIRKCCSGLLTKGVHNALW